MYSLYDIPVICFDLDYRQYFTGFTFSYMYFVKLFSLPLYKCIIHSSCCWTNCILGPVVSFIVGPFVSLHFGPVVPLHFWTSCIIQCWISCIIHFWTSCILSLLDQLYLSYCWTSLQGHFYIPVENELFQIRLTDSVTIINCITIY